MGFFELGMGWDEIFSNVGWDEMGWDFLNLGWDGTRFFQTGDGMRRNFLNVGWNVMKNRMGWDRLGMNPGRKTCFSFGTIPLNIFSFWKKWSKKRNSRILICRL